MCRAFSLADRNTSRPVVSALQWLASPFKILRKLALKLQCTCTAQTPGQSLNGGPTKLLQGKIKIPESKLWSQRQKARRASECRTKDGDAAKRGSHVSLRDFQSFVQMTRCPSHFKLTSWDLLFSRLRPNCKDYWRWCWTIWSLKIHRINKGHIYDLCVVCTISSLSILMW